METLLYVVDFVVRTTIRFAPVFALSVLLAAIVKSLPIAEVASRWLAQRQHASIAAGSLLGSFSPLCSCTVVPVVRSLLVAGAPLAGVMAFWIASPLMDPEIFVLSVGLLGWDIAVARLVAALVLSVGAGVVVLLAVRSGWLQEGLEDAHSSIEAAPAPAKVLVGAGVGSPGGGVDRALPVAPVEDVASCCGDDDGAPAGEVRSRGVVASLRGLDWVQVRTDALAEGWKIGRWILLAFALEALILRFVPQEAMVAVLGRDAPWAVPAAALLGIPLYMDSLSALPVVDGLLETGMAPGAAIAFLLAGPVTTIPAMTAVRAVLPGRVFRTYLGVSLVGSIVLGFAVNVVL